MGTPATYYTIGARGDPAWPGGGSGRKPHTTQAGLAPGENAWALGEGSLPVGQGRVLLQGLGGKRW